MGGFGTTYKRRFARILKSEIRDLEEQIYAWMAEVRERDEKIKFLKIEIERLQRTQKMMNELFPLLKILLKFYDIVYPAICLKSTIWVFFHSRRKKS